MPNRTSIRLSNNIMYEMYKYRSIGKLGMLSTKGYFSNILTIKSDELKKNLN